MKKESPIPTQELLFYFHLKMYVFQHPFFIPFAYSWLYLPSVKSRQKSTRGSFLVSPLIAIYLSLGLDFETHGCMHCLTLSILFRH